MLDNIGGYAVDKARFWFELTWQELLEHKTEWGHAFGDAVGPQGGKVYNIQSVKRGERDGAYYYAFDVWGEAAAHIDTLDFELWYPHLDRLDIKLPMPMTPEGRDNYAAYVQEKVGDKRNFGWTDSKVRQKRGHRDAGGKSFYIGSHKSDFRVHWTLRGQESGYQEFQLQNTRLANAKTAMSYYVLHPDMYGERIGWQGLCQNILAFAQVELSSLDGLYDNERASLLAGNLDQHGVIERKVEYIEHQIDKLPQSALFALYDALQEKLFGVPPAATVLPESIEYGPSDEDTEV